MAAPGHLATRWRGPPVKYTQKKAEQRHRDMGLLIMSFAYLDPVMPEVQIFPVRG